MNHIEPELFVPFTFIFLTIAIGVLGVSVLSRLSKAGELGRPARGSVTGHSAGRSAVMAPVVVMLLVLGFISTLIPYLALIPAAVLLVFGMVALLKGGTLNRDGGIVLLLVAALWFLFTAIQVATLASKADIRVDLLITLPITTFAGSIGWKIFRDLPAAGGHGAGEAA